MGTDGPKKHWFKRRDFIKTSLAAAGGLLFSSFLDLDPKKIWPDVEGRTEGISWKNQLFFEDIENFNPELLEQIKTGLTDFAKIFGPTIKENLLETFDIDLWNEGVRLATSRLKRIHLVYQTLSSSSQLDEVKLRLLNEDFAEVASPIWATLRIGERFDNDTIRLGSELRDQVAKFRNPESEDPFLGSDARKVVANWAHRFYDRTYSGFGTAMLFSPYALDYLTRLEPWQDKLGKENLVGLQSDEALESKRPREALINTENEFLGDKFREALQRNLLNRVGISHTTYLLPEEDTRYAGYYSADERRMVYDLPNIDASNYEDYRHFLLSLLYHETSHGILMTLLPLIPDDSRRFLLYAKIEELRAYFLPHQSVKLYFQPEGKHNTICPLDTTPGFHWNDESFRKKYTLVNQASVTDYPIKSNRADVKTSWMLSDISQIVNREDLLQDRELVFRHIADLSSQTTGENFSDYWKLVDKELRSRGSYEQMNLFERKIFDFINQEPEIFDAIERTFYYEYMYDPHNDWHDYLVDKVIPIVTIELYKNDLEGAIQGLKQVASQDEIEVIKHRLRIWCSEMSRPEDSSKELLAEIFSKLLMTKEPGVVNELPDLITRKFDSLYSELMDSLIANGLALNQEGKFI